MDNVIKKAITVEMRLKNIMKKNKLRVAMELMYVTMTPK